MTSTLVRHPATPCEAVSGLSVEALRHGNRLDLRYRLRGDIGALVIPAPRSDAGRTDELWKTTCFEAFVRAPEAPEYWEMNFAPSGDWAAYSFSGYRAGMSPALDIVPEPPVFEVREGGAELSVQVGLAALPPRRWRLSLTAVIEEAGGRLSYWALAHPPGRPDFHHADGFVLELT